MTAITTVVLHAPDVAAAEAFYAAFGVGDRVRVRAADAATSGFRGYTLSLVVARPNIVDAFVEAALAAGATAVKPAKKSFWGYGAVIQAPDGALWKIASSSKKNDGPATRTINDFVLLLGVEDVKATKQFYVEQGLEVEKSYGGKYVQFTGTPGPANSGVTLGLYGRKALAKDAGVPAEGSGSHGITVIGDTGTFTDLDGFDWDSVAVDHPAS